MSRKFALLAVLALLGSLGSAGVAGATFPGRNGDIAIGFSYSDGTQIEAIAPDGAGGFRYLVDGLDPSFTASGATLLFHYEDESSAAAAAFPLSGAGSFFLTEPNPYVRERTPAAAPSGDKFAFAVLAGQEFRLFVSALPGNGFAFPRGLRTAGRCPDWSPDGRSIVYQGRKDRVEYIGRVTPEGRALKRVYTLKRGRAGTIGCPSWSPDGRLVAVADTKKKQIVLASPSGRVKRRLAYRRDVSCGSRAAQFEPGVAFSPDGRQLAYGDDAVGLNIVTLRNGSARRIAECASGEVSWRPLPPG